MAGDETGVFFGLAGLKARVAAAFGRLTGRKVPLMRIVFIVVAPGEGVDRPRGWSVFSGVNRRPLPSGIVFTHAPSQAGRRMPKGRRGGKNFSCGQFHSILRADVVK